MTLQLEQKAAEAVIHGPPRTLIDGAAPTVIANIARRVAETPDGLMRSFQSDGTLREQTFAEAWRRSGEIAIGLQSLGVGPGSQAVLLLRDLLDFVPAFWASLRAGATPAAFGGIAHAGTAEELNTLAARLEHPVFVADAGAPDLDRLAELLPDAPILRLSSLSGGGGDGVDPAREPDTICLLPTSGSTGTAKIVMLGRRAVLHRSFSQNYSVAFSGAHILSVFPFEGISGMRFLYPTYASLTQLHPRILASSPLTIFEAIGRFAITNAFMTNSMAARLVEEAAKSQSNSDLSSLKAVVLGGETVTRLVARRFDRLLRQRGAARVLRASYGTTETSSLLAGADPSACPLDDAGAPILGGAAAGISLRIVGDDGLTLCEGEVGHVEAFAPQTFFAGYWKEPELSRNCLTADGWYKTGDLGAINDGGFSFRGRAKQTLVVGGRKFSLDDIDACLQSDADIGRRTVSFVARRLSDATDGLGVAVAAREREALDSVTTGRIRHALVRRYGLAPVLLTPVRTGEWPLTAAGKVDRRALAERAAKAGESLDRETAPASSEIANPMTLQLDEKVREAVIHGPERTLMDGAAPTVIANIARRVAETPDGLMRSFQSDGTLREQTFAEAWRRSGEIAGRLRNLGVGPGSQAVLLLRDLLDFVPCFWASLRIGATPIPFAGVAHVATVGELENLAAHVDHPALIADAPTPDLDRLAAVLPDAPVLCLSTLAHESEDELDPGDEPDVTCLLPTSGSTGNVKFVMLGRRAMLHRYFSQNYSQGSLTANVLNVFPFEGVTGLRAAFPTYASVTQLHPRMLTIRPLAVFEAIERFAVNLVQMTNSMAARLVEDAAGSERGFDLGSLRIVGLGGEAVTRLVATRFDALLRRNGAANVLRAGYGSTETSSLLVGADPSACPLDEGGAPILGGCAAGVSLRIVGDDGVTRDEGEVGHVEALAPQTSFAGYWKEPVLSRDCMTADGWWKTGDLGAINAGGFSFRGRAKQTLVLGGRKFSLDDIDAHLQADPEIGRQTVSFVVRDRDDATDGLGIAVAISDGEALDGALTDTVRQALVRRYGFTPSRVTTVRTGEWPLTATGKVDRKALAEREVKAGESLKKETASPPSGTDDEAVLAFLWREALNLDGDFGRDDNFFDRGGDSLRAASLLTGVDKRFRRQLALSDFFALPTFNNLLRLVQGAPAQVANDQQISIWPLDREISRGMLSYVEGWSGERVSEDRLLLGLNRQGSSPPLFCVFNAGHEFENLADALGSDQPVYAFRSSYLVGDYGEDLIQALALRYVNDIQEARPDGPLFLLGQCQGGRIALAMAQHLLLRGRHLPLLILVDWPTELAFYPGDVLLLYGRESVLNPKFASFNPEPAWRRMFGRFSRAEVEGAHAELYLEQNMASLAGELARRLGPALSRSRPFSPLKECAFEFAVGRAPGRARPGARLRFEVAVKNIGKAPIGGESSSLRLGGFWARDGAKVGVRFVEAAPLPAIAPQGVWVKEILVLAPQNEGKFDLALDLFEERGDSLTGLGAAPSAARVKVARISTRIQKILGRRFSARKPDRRDAALTVRPPLG
jgi:acyl-CoA synthetase (AMP-forming)/AMP-acid ligase II/thioesterase domain-containing protein/acyl carrier protein